MNVGWVAATVRARGLVRRRLGREGTRLLAHSPSAEVALESLAATPYASRLVPFPGLATPRRSVAAIGLWHIRVLAGWLPPGGAAQLRALAGWYEAANIEGRLAALADGTPEHRYPLGSLATSWGRLAACGSAAELRRALAASVWGDPGSDDPGEAAVSLRLSWARRLAAEVPMAAPWATGRAALVVATATAAGRRLPEAAAADARRLLGHEWEAATTVGGLAAALPRAGAWALSGVRAPEELWRAELAWWDRVEHDALALAGQPRPGPAPVVGAAALLMADAWRVGVALEVVAGGARELADELG